MEFLSFGFIIVLTIFLYLIYFSDRNSKKLEKIPGPAPSYFFGNILEIYEDPLETFHKYSKRFPKIFKYYYFNQPIVVVTDPQLIRHILSNNAKNYWKDQDEIILEVIGKGLLLSNGEFWSKQRNLMVPAFGYSFMKQMVPFFVQTGEVLIKKWENLCNSGNSDKINLHSEMTKLTLDVIGLAGFGYEFNALIDEHGLIPKSVGTVLEESEKRIFELLPFWKLPFSSGTRKFNHAKKILLREIENMIEKRKKNGIDKNAGDLLGRLLVAENEETGEKMSDKQLRDELITFLIAGHETTAAMLAFFFFNVSQHPRVEEKLIEEIERVVGDRNPVFEDFTELKYLDLVIKETMRIYPSVSMQTTRITMEDDVLAGFEIPKGTNIEIWPWLLHRNEEYWDDPLSFQPERFESKLKETFAYLPFGAGSRDCIGRKLALSEAKIVIAMILQKFILEFNEKESGKMEPKLAITLRPKKLIMKISKREKKELF